MDKPRARTVAALVAELADRYPHGAALVDGSQRWTYGELAADVDTVARALLASGIARGERIGLLAGNRAEWVLTDLAAMSIGAIAVGLNTWSTARELAWQLAHAEVRLLLVESRFRERDFRALLEEARALAGGLPALGRTLVLDPHGAGGGAAWHGWLAAGNGVDDAHLATARAAVRGDDVGCLLYTSGSTALPKGVPLLQQALIDNMWEIGERQHLVAGDRLWLAVSLFWSLASVNALFALLTHGGSVGMQHAFDAGQALELIERERCTVFYGTPNMTLALAEHPQRTSHDLSSLRTGVTIGTPAQIDRVAALGVHAICNVYGLTESYGNSTVTDAGLALERRRLTVGQALPGNRLRIVDVESGRVLPPGEAGEIQIAGHVTPGYWQDAERTAEAFSADGWFRSGDRGHLDADGFLYYGGRLKEMVKTGGINVAPAEVEEVLSAHPAVELAFVTGIPDARLDEALAAVIVPRAGANLDEAALRSHCAASLAAYKRPRHYRFVDATALPLTTTGKLKRNELPGLFDATSAG